MKIVAAQHLAEVSGCFQSTYVSNFTLPVPRREREFPAPGGAVPGGESSFPPRER